MDFTLLQPPESMPCNTAELEDPHCIKTASSTPLAVCSFLTPVKQTCQKRITCIFSRVAITRHQTAYKNSSNGSLSLPICISETSDYHIKKFFKMSQNFFLLKNFFMKLSLHTPTEVINFSKNYLPSEISSKINLRATKITTLLYLLSIKTKARSSKILSWFKAQVGGKKSTFKEYKAPENLEM